MFRVNGRRFATISQRLYLAAATFSAFRSLDLSVNRELAKFSRFRRSAMDRIIREEKKAVFDSFLRDFTDIGSERGMGAKGRGCERGKCFVDEAGYISISLN